MIIAIAIWIAIGLIVGMIATKVVDLHGDDPRLGLAVTCGSAIVAAGLYSIISGAGVSAGISGRWHSPRWERSLES